MNHKEVYLLNQPMEPVKLALIPGCTEKQLSEITNVMLTVKE